MMVKAPPQAVTAGARVLARRIPAPGCAGGIVVTGLVGGLFFAAAIVGTTNQIRPPALIWRGAGSYQIYPFHQSPAWSSGRARIWRMHFGKRQNHFTDPSLRQGNG